MKKILVISYYWPPSGGSGVQRWLYFSYYLKKKGMDVTVLTIDPKTATYPSFDTSLLEKTKGIKTAYSKNRFSPIHLYTSLKKKRSRQVPSGNFGDSKKSSFDRLAGFIRGNFFIPDARITWNKSAIRKGIELFDEVDFDIIITTGPPQSTHLIGKALKAKFNTTWIADFRDPWTEVYYNSLFKRTKFAQSKDEHLEKSVLNSADLVLTVGPGMRSLLLKKRGKAIIKYIYNGFDHMMFDDMECVRYPEFTIAHIGLWKLLHSYQEIIVALTHICEIKKRTVRIVIAGSVDTSILESLRNINGLIVDYKGTLLHKEAVQEMLNSDVLLNCQPILPETKYLISGKSMEYLATGNFCITIGNADSDVSRLMTEFDNAQLIEHGNSTLLTEVILKQMSKERTIPKMSPKILQYSRESATDRLIEIINNF